MRVSVYPPALQGVGEFDGGKITEQKPIGFPGERSVVKRVGPLFYWAWMNAPVEGYIPPHPHNAFEIMTYMLHGKAVHGDSLGTNSTVGPGGAQIMQTGSGVYHEERIVGPDAEGFQIWFEPNLDEAFKRTPTYRQYDDPDFPVDNGSGYLVKTIIGDRSPVRLEVDALMWDISVDAGGTYRHPVQAGRTLAALAVRGGGAWVNGAERSVFAHKDFVMLHVDSNGSWELHAEQGTALRMIVIDVPQKVDYPLYPKR